MDVKLLQSKNIPKKLWEMCFIINNEVYLPNGNMTAQEVYNKIQADKQIDICSDQTTEEKITEMQTAITQIQEQIALIAFENIEEDEE